MNELTDYAAVSELQQMEQARHYVDWTYRQIEPWLGSTVLEAGAGIGTYTELLSQNGRRVLAAELAPNCLEFLNARFAGNPEVTPLHVDVATEAGVREIMSGWKPFDAIVCLNVLEHIRDDVAALRNFCALLRPGGKLCLMVPAFPIAFGPLDHRLGHYRRYRRLPLRTIVKDAGFRVVEDYYFNAVGLFGWTWVTRIRRQDHISLAQVLTYDRWIFPVVRWIERRVRPPFGQSLYLFAERV